MSRLTHALATLYALAAGGLCAYTCWANRRGDTAEVIVLATCAVLFGCAIVHHAYHRDELRFARIRHERAARPANSTPAVEGVVAVALAAACCERWWTSAGAEHDPDHCTRKDTSA